MSAREPGPGPAVSEQVPGEQAHLAGTGPRPLADQEGRARLRRALAPRPTRGQVLAGLLCAVLGLGLAVQVRSTQEAGLDTLREQDLLGLLNDVTERSTRLQAESRDLERTRDELTTGSDTARAALEQAQARATALGILAGTLPAEGPGVEARLSDPAGLLDSTYLIDAVQELRGAGAEAIQVNDVRVVAGTAFVDGDVAGGSAGGTILVDDRVVAPPYQIYAIGDPATLSKALEIPGGVVDAVSRAAVDELGNPRATVTIRELDRVVVDALATTAKPGYAVPVPEETTAGE